MSFYGEMKYNSSPTGNAVNHALYENRKYNWKRVSCSSL